MKLSEILKIAKDGGFLATDKKPEDLEAAIVAADKSLPGNVASSKEIMDRKTAKDAARAARDAKVKEARDARDKKFGEDRKAARDARDAEMAKKRKEADDSDPEHTNDAAMEKEAADEATMEAEDEDYSKCGDPSTPGGNRAKGKVTMDEAAVDAKVTAAVAARDALHEAREAVLPIVGKITGDSAAEVYRAGLKALGVDTKGVHDSALAGMLKMAKDKAATPAVVTGATDAATVTAMAKAIPGYDRLK